MVATVVEAFVQAKTERIDESRALYSVGKKLDSVELVKAVSKRGGAAISAMLATAIDACFGDLALTSYMFVAAMLARRARFLKVALRRRCCALRAQLASLCLGYLEREALPR